MKSKAGKFYKFVLFWLVILPIYQDSPFSIFLGAAGYSIIMPLSLIFIMAYILVKGKVPKNPRLTELMRLGYYLCVVSAIAIVIWYVLGNPLTVVGEFLPIKAIKVCLQYFSYPAYIALILICVRKVGVEYLERYAYFTLLFLTGICFIELQQIPYALRALHFAGGFPYWRVRLLTMESSWTAMMIYVYGFLALYYGLKTKKKYLICASIICLTFLIITSGSKTVIGSVGIVLALYVLLSFNRRMARAALLKVSSVILLGVICIAKLHPVLAQSINIDISNYTSIATRFYTALIGLGIGIVMPTGVGGAVYLGIFQRALRHYLFVFDKLPIRLNTSEIISLISSQTDIALTVKSGVLQRNMYWGILGTLYIIHNFVNVSRMLRDNHIQNNVLLRSVFWCGVIMMTFACEFSFEFWLFYAYLIYLNEAKKNTDRWGVIKISKVK